MTQMRRATAGLASLALLALFAAPAARADTVETTTPGGVQVIISNADATPAPRARRATARRSAPAHNDGDIGGDEGVADGGSSLGASIVSNALRYLGVPYVWGGASPRGFDCSGFVQYVYGTLGIHIPRTADVQWAAGRPIAGDPMPGDLVFFQTYDYGASHVGIYLGDGKFVNSIGDNVHITSFASGYFRSRYLGARRFLPDN
jgi:cell wall-associated NlpC family hydrolase